MKHTIGKFWVLLLVLVSALLPGTALSQTKRIVTPVPLFVSFVTTVAGFDSTIAISNTSRDPFGTPESSGSCLVRLLGSNAPAPFSVGPIAPGRTVEFSLASGAPALGAPAVQNFRGSVIIECTFSQARAQSWVVFGTLGLQDFEIEDATPVYAPVDSTTRPIIIPFAPASDGLDTGVSITNLSGQFGIAPSSGTCQISYYGVMGGSPQTTQSILPGGVLIFSVGSGGNYGVASRPGFQGYMVVNCSFPVLAPYVFVENTTSRKNFLVSTERVTLPRATSGTSRFIVPFATRDFGYGTVITIANTGLDPFGTTGTPGACTITGFNSDGATNPPPFTTGSISPGSSISVPVSSFVSSPLRLTGYLTVSCPFPHASVSARLQVVDGSSAFAQSRISVEPVELPRPLVPTRLIVPYVISSAGLASALSVINTSSDAFGTTPVSADCQVNWYLRRSTGESASASANFSIPAGRGRSAVLGAFDNVFGTGGIQSFFGYGLVSCNSPHVRAVVSLNDNGSQYSGSSVAEVIAALDSDGDTTPDYDDGCDNDPQKTSPGVCGCGTPDTDSDQDGTPNCNDQCPQNPGKIVPGVCGCSVPDADSDSDGFLNCIEACPTDPLKQNPGVCGCGSPDLDSDNDGSFNCNDSCPLDPLKVVVGICGCGLSDADSDGDGTANCNDACATDLSKIQPGACGCGVSDSDADGDGTPDCQDSCAEDPKKTSPGDCGCGSLEEDLNANGVADCLSLEELRAALTIIKSNANKLNAAQFRGNNRSRARAQRELAKRTREQLIALESFVNERLGDLSVRLPSFNFTQKFQALKVAAGRTLKFSARSFRRDKQGFLKAIDAFAPRP